MEHSVTASDANRQTAEFGIFDWVDSKATEPGEVYEERLRLLEYADRAGFFCYHLAEHHHVFDQSPRGLGEALEKVARHVHVHLGRVEPVHDVAHDDHGARNGGRIRRPAVKGERGADDEAVRFRERMGHGDKLDIKWPEREAAAERQKDPTGVRLALNRLSIIAPDVVEIHNEIANLCMAIGAWDLARGCDRVAKALDHAIDCQKIDNVTFLGAARPAESIIPASAGAGWHNPHLKPVSFDLALANKLLDQAGFKKGSDGIRVADGQKMSYEVVAPTDVQSIPRTFQILQTDFKKIGVQLKQQALDSSAAFADP